MTPQSMFLWGFGLFFLLSWIFVLGILVGRGFLPGAVTAISGLKNQITRLQETVVKDRSKDLKSSNNIDMDPKLAFYEKLSSKKNEVQKKWTPEKKILQPKNQHPPLDIIDPVIKATGKKNQQLAITPKVELDIIDNAMYYTVQLASLESKEKAAEMINRLKKQGYPAYYYEVKIKGRVYYRIRCGKFPDRKEADKYVGKLARERGIKGFVSTLE